ncbi:hypothetical protein ACFOTA_01505 [Chitinophaga sp. GCM10012297]|uniref:Uncharacterized protein n=1 Tax=Chitinophaga chungangae TaxID=2821488 RepID=A0ABS3Y871_9BACT|nr:hypothetical protein [Chitinophaga chungangae]MBO9150869.1 hypothetical protein [Chitinophaga chungangae]
MKALFLFIFFAALGMHSASAQQKTRDILFPNYASDQAKLKENSLPLSVRPVEATLANREAIRAYIFSNTSKAAGGSSARPVSKTAPATLPSAKSAEDAGKEIQAEREALKAKTIVPKIDQGAENSPKPKN